MDKLLEMRAFRTALGWMAWTGTTRELHFLTIGHPSRSAAIEAACCQAGLSLQLREGPLETLSEDLVAYAEGEFRTFRAVRLALDHLTPFQRKVCAACRAIPYGATRTYAQLASRAGSSGAARAVGNTMARNRFPIVVPCHRVVGSGGALGGFSAPSGIDLKRRMLALEGNRAGVVVTVD